MDLVSQMAKGFFVIGCNILPKAIMISWTINGTKKRKSARITDAYTIGGFRSFVHDLLGSQPGMEPGKFAFSGHVHPVIVISGKAETIVAAVSCFYFASKRDILFCLHSVALRGGYRIDPDNGDDVCLR